MLVSIIIVSWNAREYLKTCLLSLKEQACAYPVEVIVVDNASSDGSPELVEAEFPDVHLVRNPANLGFAKANNIGISLSAGNYVCLINSDVKVSKDCITRLVGYCERESDVGLVGPRVVGADGRLQRSCRGFPTLWNMFCRAMAMDSVFPRTRAFTGYSLSHWSQDAVRLVDILSGCFWVARRDAVNQVGLLDESFFMYGEDMDWCKRFWNSSWKLAFVPVAEAIHYGGASSSNSPIRFYIERQRADLQYWRKHHSVGAARTFYLISCLHLVLRTGGYSLMFLFKKRFRSSYRYKISRSIACLRWMLGERLPTLTNT